jgi:hypothetical protein
MLVLREANEVVLDDVAEFLDRAVREFRHGTVQRLDAKEFTKEGAGEMHASHPFNLFPFFDFLRSFGSNSYGAWVRNSYRAGGSLDWACLLGSKAKPAKP